MSLAGEYRVASELLKRGLNATVTFGHAKSADVIAYGSNRKAVVVEVKTTQQKKFVTGFYNKYKTPEQEHPDFWVFIQIRLGPAFNERFFILTHTELSVIQAKLNRDYRIRCGDITEHQSLSWEDHYRLTTEAHGVDNVKLPFVEEYEDQWDKIVNACNE